MKQHALTQPLGQVLRPYVFAGDVAAVEESPLGNGLVRVKASFNHLR